MFTSRAQKQTLNTQPPDALLKDAHFQERTLDFDNIISTLKEKLPAKQILVHPTTMLSKEGNELVHLRTGDPQPAEFVRDMMLRLELLKTIDRNSFEALGRYFGHGTVMEDWAALTNASYGLGNVRESVTATKDQQQRLIQAFWNGFSSAFTLGLFLRELPSAPTTPRVDFIEKPGVRDIFISSLRGGKMLGNPEIIY